MLCYLCLIIACLVVCCGVLVCGLFGWLLGFGFIVAACFGIGWLIRLNNVLVLGVRRYLVVLD